MNETQNFDFDSIVNRENTNCLKYDARKQRFGNSQVLPLWVADMDFRVLPEITAEFENIVKHGIYGYHFKSDVYTTAVVHWFYRKHAMQLKADEIFFTPGVVPAISYLIQAFTNPGDGIVIQTPVYHPFLSIVKNNNRKLLINQLVENNNYYTIDFDDFEFKASQAKIFILCSPHNPLSRVWKIEELEKIAKICLKHKVLIISDEIHSDIVFDGYQHVPMINISKEIADITFTCHSPSKTFNLAGLGLGFIFITNPELRKIFKTFYNNLYVDTLNIFAYESMRIAYNKGEGWLQSCLNYIFDNYGLLKNFLENYLPLIKVSPLEATYMAWLDFRQLGFDDKTLRSYIINKANLGLNDGPSFGPGGSGFQRINLACPRKFLITALNRLLIAQNFKAHDNF